MLSKHNKSNIIFTGTLFIKAWKVERNVEIIVARKW